MTKYGMCDILNSNSQMNIKITRSISTLNLKRTTFQIANPIWQGVAWYARDVIK